MEKYESTKEDKLVSLEEYEDGQVEDNYEDLERERAERTKNVLEEKDVWGAVMAQKKNDKRSNGVANNLTEDELETIIATIDYFGGSVQQAMFDLSVCRYRIFDWLAMGVMGGRIGSESATKVLAFSFLLNDGDIDKWIEDLRVSDYDANYDWTGLKI